MKLYECVPNFSEGRDQKKIVKIASSLPIKVLDKHSDPDHNRTVLTFVGTQEEIEKAAFTLCKVCLSVLDIRKHEGVHPYIGAVDVIPIIPITKTGATFEEANEMAHNIGKKVWDNFEIPVYFYGEAALASERKILPKVRNIGYVELRGEISKSYRKPDLGDELHQTFGIVAIGVRDFLIGFNINLDTSKLDIAKKIAAEIREKDGGFPGVRALGFHLETRGVVQVSMNITDHKKASLRQVFDAVKKEAGKHRVSILNSELVGMIPKEAVFTRMKEYLQLEEFNKEKIIEAYLK
jgi:glutamate formiminotransferase